MWWSDRLDRAPTDVNEFLEVCFADPAGRPLRQGAVHRELQAFLSANRHALVELPRDHGKSTQVCARLVWELGRDPGLRVVVVCASEALAAARGRFVREAVEANRFVRAVFPHLAPARPWSDTRFTVVRPARVIGPSLLAIGVGAASTGSRADLLVCDDIVDETALHSPAGRERVKDRFRDNLMNLLEPDGRFWGLYTPWHKDDLNAELKRVGSYPVFRRAVGDDLEPVWPERWPREALAARRAEIGPGPFARAYRLVQVPDDEAPIPLRLVQFWTEPAEAERVILSVDPAVSKHAGADQSALVVLGRCGDEVRVLDAVARRVDPVELMELIGEVDALWGPQAILFESNGAFRAVAELMARQAPFGPKLVPWTQTKDKRARVLGLSIPVSNGRFRLKGDGKGGVDPSQRDLLDEMTTFPAGEHDDLVDAAATGAAYLLNQKEPRVIEL